MILTCAVLFLVFIAGSGDQEAPGKKDALRQGIERWLAASERAYHTRTHATLDHPRAIAEARQAEQELRAYRLKKVRAAVAKKRAELSRQRAEAKKQLASITVAGKSHTEDERKQIDRLSAVIERLEVEGQLLLELRKKFESGPASQGRT